jgi:hypothetical protein
MAPLAPMIIGTLAPGSNAACAKVAGAELSNKTALGGVDLMAEINARRP